MKRKNFEHLECPLAYALGIVGEWWSLLIIRDLFYGINTFSDLEKDLGIAKNILSDRLAGLEAERVVEKKAYSQKPLRHKYVLTDKGKDLFPVIMSMVAWSQKWEPRDKPAILFRHGPHGHLMDARLTCAQCGEAITPRSIRPVPGPGAQNPGALPLPLRPGS